MRGQGALDPVPQRQLASITVGVPDEARAQVDDLPIVDQLVERGGERRRHVRDDGTLLLMAC